MTASANPRPKSVFWISVYSAITILIAVFSGSLWTSSLPHDTYESFDFVSVWLALPMYAILAYATVGLFRGREWGLKWMLRWGAIVTAYEIIQLILAVLWIAPLATPHDLGLDPAGLAKMSAEAGVDLSGFPASLEAVFGPDYPSAYVKCVAAVEAVGMLSLSVWALWSLNRPKVRHFFEPR